MANPVRLLYVDDDAGLGRLLTKALASQSVEVVHVETGRDAVAALQGGQFDVVALDHNLVGETGLDVLDAFKALANVPPVIYVTGSDDVRVAVAALKAGAVDYVWKDTLGQYRELLGQAVDAAIAQATLKRQKDEAEAEMRRARERAELLLAEVNHRVANSLTLVASFTRMQESAVTDEACRAALRETDARIRAVAGVHRHLYARNSGSDVRKVEICSYIQALVQEHDVALGQDSSVRVRMTECQSAFVRTDDAITLGVIAAELITNACKYAYGATGGEVRVHVRRLDDARGELVVEDDGAGWSGKGTFRGTGVGSRILNALSRSLESEVVYDARKGTVATIAFRTTEP